jgi:hypothetical protein
MKRIEINSIHTNEGWVFDLICPLCGKNLTKLFDPHCEDCGLFLMEEGGLAAGDPNSDEDVWILQGVFDPPFFRTTEELIRAHKLRGFI